MKVLANQALDAIQLNHYLQLGFDSAARIKATPHSKQTALALRRRWCQRGQASTVTLLIILSIFA
jgi:hypothetical protein